MKKIILIVCAFSLVAAVSYAKPLKGNAIKPKKEYTVKCPDLNTVKQSVAGLLQTWIGKQVYKKWQIGSTPNISYHLKVQEARDVGNSIICDYEVQGINNELMLITKKRDIGIPVLTECSETHKGIMKCVKK